MVTTEGYMFFPPLVESDEEKQKLKKGSITIHSSETLAFTGFPGMVINFLCFLQKI